MNIAGVAWSNFEPGIDINGRIAIINISSPSIDGVNVSGSIDESVVSLKKEGGERGSVIECGVRLW
jgi:hypothetical protein